MLDILSSNKAYIAITTGRPVLGIKNMLPDKLYKLLYLIGLNGGIAKEPNGEILNVYRMGYDDLIRVNQFGTDIGADMCILDAYNYYPVSKQMTGIMHYDVALNKMEMLPLNIAANKNLFTKSLLFINPEKKMKLEKVYLQN